MPAFIWVGVGVLVAFVYGKVSSFFQGGPQAAQARMMSWVRGLSMQHAASLPHHGCLAGDALPQLQLGCH